MPASTLQSPVLDCPVPVDELDCTELRTLDLRMQVLRLDTIHPCLNGNKWFKLKYNIQRIQQLGLPRVLSFGGAYSNHLRALAAAGRSYGFATVGLVRGELVQPLNPVLDFASRCGMTLVPVSRSQYRRKSDPDYLLQLRREFGDFYLLPEGGSNALALAGCREIARCIPPAQQAHGTTVVMLACGTGVTLAGVLQGMAGIGAGASRVIGVSVLKAPGYLQGEVERWLGSNTGPLPDWSMEERFHGGGYGRSDRALGEFLDWYRQRFAVPVEPVYSGKLFHAAFSLAREGRFPRGSRVLLIHSGGLYEPEQAPAPVMVTKMQ